jgi:phosphinothricin acetyltransferase
MTIRQAQLNDLDSIIAIYNQAIRNRQTGDITELTIQDRKSWFDDHDDINFPIFVYEDGDSVLGWLSLSRYRPGREAFAHVAEISYYIDEHQTGKGIGKRLMEHCIEYLKDKEVSILIAIILGSNTNSIAFTKNSGFELWAVLPEVAEIDGKAIDHVYMGKKL